MADPPSNEAVQVFPPAAVIDSCAVTNVLSSRCLRLATVRKGLRFILPGIIVYECLIRKRTNPSAGDAAVQQALQDEIKRGTQFYKADLTVDDLREVARLRGIKSISTGELACMTLARRMRHGFLTDDGDARKLAQKEFDDLVTRTTSHLVGWLVYVGELSDGDVTEVVRDNTAVRGKGIAEYIDACYRHALSLRLQQEPQGAQ